MAPAPNWQQKAQFAGHLATNYFGQSRPLSDSFGREAPEVERHANEPSKADYYDEVGELYKRQGEPAKAIAYYLKEQGVAKATGDLRLLQKCALKLDRVYRWTGCVGEGGGTKN